ncbi:hypothetical protein [Saccharopolyspora gregorii]|uniref:Transposase n=1 Tax=Saccharopolyspora gregorii TaxID=33914 RepID=A0ABP6RWR7_9PSEU
MTSAHDGRDHLVGEAEMAEGLAGRQGRYRARCGLLVLVAELSRPPALPCPRCREADRRPGRRDPVAPGEPAERRFPARWACCGPVSPRGTQAGPDRHGR